MAKRIVLMARRHDRRKVERGADGTRMAPAEGIVVAIAARVGAGAARPVAEGPY